MKRNERIPLSYSCNNRHQEGPDLRFLTSVVRGNQRPKFTHRCRSARDPALGCSNSPRWYNTLALHARYNQRLHHNHEEDEDARTKVSSNQTRTLAEGIIELHEPGIFSKQAVDSCYAGHLHIRSLRRIAHRSKGVWMSNQFGLHAADGAGVLTV